MRKVIFGPLLLLFLFLHALQADEKSHIFELNARLGRGMNIGNMFEAPSKNAWGNLWNPAYAKIIADLGFSHVRVPILWEMPDRTMPEFPYTISTEFLASIKEVVDDALAHNLHVIINMHHHETLFANPDGQHARFLSQWQQIADYFKSYPDSLLFEIMNEPQKKMTIGVWNQFFKEALWEIRQTNPTRGVLVTPSEWGGIDGLNGLEWPDDDNLILTMHYYNPFKFTHQGADWANMGHVTGVEWFNTEIEQETVRLDFLATRAFARKHVVPVHIGEFGTYQKADLDSRVRWTTYLARFFEKEGYSWAYWEFSAAFGIYTPSTGELLQPLVSALLHNSSPEPAPMKTSVVYQSDFEKNGADDWFFQHISGAQGGMSVESDALHLNLLTQVSDSWHFQLMKFDVPIEKGRRYRLSFKASSTQDGRIFSYVGQRASPWDIYGGYFEFALFNQEETYSYVFTMSKSDDAHSRFVFDLGALPIPATVVIRDVKLELIEADDTSNHSDVLPDDVSDESIAFFDPDRQSLLLRNTFRRDCRVTVYTMMGAVVFSDLIKPGSTYVTTSHWQPGIYIVVLDDNHIRHVQKIIKGKM